MSIIMALSKLQILLILVALSFMLFSLKIFKRKKIWVLTFIIFFWGALAIGILSLKIERLNAIGITFGLNRGADLIVYSSIIILFYLLFHLLNTLSKNGNELTRLISAQAIQNAYSEIKTDLHFWKNQSDLDDFIFNIRVYNEAEVLGKVIDELLSFGVRKMLFINDGSQDASLEILEQKKTEHPEAMMIILSHIINRGGGAANKTGYAFIKRYAEELQIKRIVGFDPDGQMDITDLTRFQAAILKNPKADLFLGSRFISWATTIAMPKMRHIILWISRLVVRLFYGAKVSDPHNWFRVFSLSALKKIELNADGMHYANEINEQIWIHKLNFVEVPVNIRYTEHSLAKGQKNSNSIKLGFEMIARKFFSN